MSSKKEIEKRWITPKELKALHGFGLSTQAKMRVDKKIPYYKIGHFIKYDLNEINQWIENNKVDVRK
ncbi:MAG: Unknown protein [uncultured Sulfurovum sp.]|uniref:Helix-turn-helix domain-containing protein n=1 Tax=uncultured Sulfurovum sp. TaxID=269237 RepID=A0A6S6SKD9_9BACT|nr:MAG: Unknown protein [uncultured Sulfurovum sp.]